MKKNQNKIKFIFFAFLVLVLMTSCTSFILGAFRVVIKNETGNNISFFLPYTATTTTPPVEIILVPGGTSGAIPITAFTAGIAYPHSILQTSLRFVNETEDKNFHLWIEGKKSPEIKVIVLTDEIWSYEYEYGNDFGYYIDGEIVHKK